MIRNIATLISGVVFGLGLTVSQMTNPDKVLAFLDVGGAWDPSLLLVLAGAVTVTVVAFRFVLKRPQPIFDKRFYLPTRKSIDRKLLGGSAVFGVGWGLVGLCPGPAITSLAFGNSESFIFLGAMIAGSALAHFWPRQVEEETEVLHPA